MSSNIHWTSYLTALLTPFVAVAGAYIAWRQSAIARNKLKLDLFDRRFKVYDEARALLAMVLTTGRVSEEGLYKFGAGTREARWLFDKSIDDYLKLQLWNNAVDLQRYESELEGLHAGNERTTIVEKRGELKKMV